MASITQAACTLYTPRVRSYKTTMSKRRISKSPRPSASALRLFARRRLRERDWNPFERHVLRLMMTHAAAINQAQATIASVSDADDIARETIKRAMMDWLDLFLSGIRPRHVATAAPLLALGKATPVNLIAGLVDRAISMLEDTQKVVQGGVNCWWDLRIAMNDLDLGRTAWSSLVLDRTSLAVDAMDDGSVDHMEAITEVGDPEGRELRESDRRMRMVRARRFVRPTVRSMEALMVRASMWDDPIVARKLRLKAWSMAPDDDASVVNLGMTIMLENVGECTVEAKVHDYGLLENDTERTVEWMKHQSSILLGRRADREARGLEEDDPSLIAAPLVAALRWREMGHQVPVDAMRTEHLMDDIELSDGVRVDSLRHRSCWIKVRQDLPDTMMMAMVGRPITDLIAHRWLDERMTVTSFFKGSQAIHFGVTMPRARLMAVDDDDGDPIGEWGLLQSTRVTDEERASEAKRRFEAERVFEAEARKTAIDGRMSDKPYCKPTSPRPTSPRPTYSTEPASRKTALDKIMTHVDIIIAVVIVAAVVTMAIALKVRG